MIILFILLLVSGASAFSCKDQDGKDVDWCVLKSSINMKVIV